MKIATKTVTKTNEKQKVRRRALFDQLLADAKCNSAQYVKNYDVKRGGE